jgi:hypothetical protein
MGAEPRSAANTSSRSSRLHYSRTSFFVQFGLVVPAFKKKEAPCGRGFNATSRAFTAVYVQCPKTGRRHYVGTNCRTLANIALTSKSMWQCSDSALYTTLPRAVARHATKRHLSCSREYKVIPQSDHEKCHL